MKAKKIGLLLTAFLLIGGTTAYAATTITYKYVVNGYAWTPKTTAKPIVSNGTTYLPVGLVKEATGVNITVDTTGKIQIGEKLNQVPILNENIVYNYKTALTKDPKFTNVDGKEYKQSILFKEAYGNIVDFNANEKYQKLSLDVQAFEKTAKVTIRDKDTKEELGAYFAEVDAGVTNFEVNITGHKNIRVVADSSGGDVVIYPSSYYK